MLKGCKHRCLSQGTTDHLGCVRPRACNNKRGLIYCPIWTGTTVQMSSLWQQEHIQIDLHPLCNLISASRVEMKLCFGNQQYSKGLAYKAGDLVIKYDDNHRLYMPERTCARWSCTFIWGLVSVESNLFYRSSIYNVLIISLYFGHGESWQIDTSNGRQCVRLVAISFLL
jgi:hypothetical protein